MNMLIVKLTNSAYKREYRDEEVAGETRCFTATPILTEALDFRYWITPMIEINSNLDNEDEEIRLNYERKILNDLHFALHVKSVGPIYIKPSPTCKPYRLGKFLLKALPNSIGNASFVVEINLVNRALIRQNNFREKERDEEIESTWSYWNKVHAAADYSHRYFIVILALTNLI